MKTERFFIRFIKSFIYFICWIFIILILMMAFNQTEMTFVDLFITKNGLFLWGFALVFSLVYPFYGYCRRNLNATATEHIEALDNIALRSGLKRVNTDLNSIEYRAGNILKKILLQFEDRVYVYTDENGNSVIAGPRKEVVKMVFRFDTYLISKENNN